MYIYIIRRFDYFLYNYCNLLLWLFVIPHSGYFELIFSAWLRRRELEIIGKEEKKKKEKKDTI